MLRFISHNMTGIDGIEIFPILSLLIFTTFFALMITYVIRMSKAKIEEVSGIPFEDDDATFNEKTNV